MLMACAVAPCSYNGEHRVAIIIRAYGIAAFCPARRTLVDDTFPALLMLDPDGFHHAVTGLFAVTGIDVDVLAPEAYWAVVRVPCAYNGRAALVAGEILDVALEACLWLVHGLSIHYCTLPNGTMVRPCSKHPVMLSENFQQSCFTGP